LLLYKILEHFYSCCNGANRNTGGEKESPQVSVYFFGGKFEI
jgi:hypothetical protein